MRVGILGTGRLGRTLAILLADRSHTVDLRGRGEVPTGEVVMLAVPDSAVAEAAATVPPGPVLLHCSGSLEIDVLRPRAPVGSLHPLMTFPGPDVALPDLGGVPAAVAGDPEAISVARQLAHSLGMLPFEVHGDRRLYHAAAVIAGNFGTVLLADAALILERCGVDPTLAPRMLVPLAIASLRNAANDPRRALTGPAARGDEPTISGHRAALSAAGLTDVVATYDALTERARALVRRADPE